MDKGDIVPTPFLLSLLSGNWGAQHFNYMDITEIAKQIGSFIEKYHNDSNRVEWPKSEFKIKVVSEVIVQESSLKSYANNLWTFEAKATIEKTATNVPTIEEDKLIGNATITPHLDNITKKESPDVKNVVITLIKKPSNTTH